MTVTVAADSAAIHLSLWAKNGHKWELSLHQRASARPDDIQLINEDGSDVLNASISEHEFGGQAAFGAEHIKGEVRLVRNGEPPDTDDVLGRIAADGFLGPEGFHDLAARARQN